ncbi:hypothetical protein RFI_15773 [Reticulomyxa filosa]|uniref:SET domain-containing protein n=1 Tax=Reticulomyxa filosa TaxID=46433 RepID=X6N607_RETFI|nr:hypothetical protein RFI_15773 [Reticulomyxa filosa]|eukprot:ETO21431.1 hypothetical protein RFI_15773 [Reticulomyxa filosa]
MNWHLKQSAQIEEIVWNVVTLSISLLYIYINMFQTLIFFLNKKKKKKKKACGCPSSECKNRLITQGKRKVLGVHVQQRPTFGIDQSTRNRIIKIGKHIGLEKEEISHFINMVLLPAFNSFISYSRQYPEFKTQKIIYTEKSINPDTAPFFFTEVLRMILHQYDQLHKSKHGNNDSESGSASTIPLHRGPSHISSTDAEITRELLQHIEQNIPANTDIDETELNIGNGPEGRYCEEFFPIYPKGNGIVCIDSNGIQKNEFIIEYFGEAYPAWRWYEKCDLQKQLERALPNAPNVPDFFNIVLERHKDDPDGYDVVFVDPIRKGNFGSRLSHSCEPNVETVVMAANGRFVIGLFATKDIALGEELTFDYNSVTESDTEYRSAICLCGMQKCRGTYLSYIGSGSGGFNRILNLHHNLLHRCALLLKSCHHSNQELTEQELSHLKANHVGSSILSNLPQWGVRFVSYLCHYLELEKSLLPNDLMENLKLSGETAFNEAFGIQQQRMQNLAISVVMIFFFFQTNK